MRTLCDYSSVLLIVLRVVFMDVPTDTILERLTLRSVDPVTGERWVLGLQVTSLNIFTVGFAPSMNILVDNGKRTEWNPIRSVIIQVINIIGRRRSGITRMVTDRVGRHEILLPINHNCNKICDILDLFLNLRKWNSKRFLLAVKKAIEVYACDGALCSVA